MLVDKNVFSRANFVTGMVEGENGILWLSTMGGLKSLRLSDHTITSFQINWRRTGRTFLSIISHVSVQRFLWVQ